MKKFTVTALIILLFSGITTALQAGSVSDFTPFERNYLINSLHKEGFSRSELESIFFSKRLKRLPNLIKQNVVNKVRGNPYDQFFTPYALNLAHQFSRNWRTLLQRAADRFQVDKHVIVSILLVETSFGSYLGNTPVISVFSSLVIENTPERRKKLIHQLADSAEKKAYYRERIQMKADWAYSELIALLTIHKQHKNIFSIRGSYAGAFGIPQFLPSSYLKWGYDSDRNGSINLYLKPDAIYSTANYLKQHGWKPGMSRRQKEEIIWHYNNSQTYSKTIIGVAERLKTRTGNRSKAPTLISQTESDNSRLQ